MWPSSSFEAIETLETGSLFSASLAGVKTDPQAVMFPRGSIDRGQGGALRGQKRGTAHPGGSGKSQLRDAI